MTDHEPTEPLYGAGGSQPGSPYGSLQPGYGYQMPPGPRPDGPPAYGSPTTPQQSIQPNTQPNTQPKRPRRGGLAVAVVATALVVGAAAGAGGAAAWNALDDESNGGAGSPARSQVVDTPTNAAAAGSVESVASKLLPSVVKIDVSGSQGSGSGSGIILSSDGDILTNNHVVEVAGEGGEISVDFNDGSSAKAKIVGTDPLTDTAVIKAEGVSDLAPATIGKSGDLKVGQSVVAIGSPFGLDSTVTSGIISALDRPVDVGNDGQGNSTTYPAIQTDAAINPGNSGGALVDMNGHVVGINASIRTASETQGESGSIGLGFAIPMDEVMPIVDQMLKGETPTHARLGISVGDVSDRSGSALEGAQVQDVNDGSAAAEAGLAKGDIVTKIDDHVITGADSLVATIRSYRPGDKVTVTYVSDGDTKTASLSLGSDAASSKS